MIKNYTKQLLLIITIASSFFFQQEAKAQCFQIYDGLGALQTAPQFIGCSGSDYTVFIQSNLNLGNYIINWGDGSANTTGTSLISPAYIQHVYAATVDTFTITITDVTSGCTVTGMVILEEPVNASIQIPLGGVTVVCAPSDIEFINSSTNVSPTTVFTWDFGDGTPIQTFGPGNAGQSIFHTYQKNTVSCETVVTLTAENACSFNNPTIANFQPLMVYDVDTAVINASATLLCYPDTVVHFDNATIKNCLPEGNVQQRFEYWNLGDYWGLGYDSIIPWIPFDPPAQPGHTIAFPGIGSYTIMMIDSNMCGQDTAYQTITIIGPPSAGLNLSNDSACLGEIVTINNNSGNGANAYYWDIDDGNGFNQYFGNPSFIFNDTGVTTVTVIASINGTSGICQDTNQVDIYIKPSPVASFSIDNDHACDTLIVNISDSTVGAAAWQWNLGNGNTSTSANPTTQYYTSPGAYNISLLVTHENGCSDAEVATVNVYESPSANFVANSVCQQSTATFTDLSYSPLYDPINTWSWDFGDGNTASTQNGTNVYNSIGSYNVTLIVATPHCADTLSDSVTVEVTPNASFTVNTNAGCSALDVVTTNTSTGATSYIWDFGTGLGSTLMDPTFTYLNNDTLDTTYTMTLIASTNFGCKDTVDVPITVFGGPQAQFTNNGIPACGPLSVNFTNASLGAVSYYWDFGDSTSGSNLVDPTHIFSNTSLFISNYTVQLIATNTQGCSDTTSHDVMVYPEPIFEFATSPDSGCSPLTVTFPAVIGAVTYAWDFGDGATATGQMPTHTFYNATTNDLSYTVQLIATSPFGCMDTTTQIVTVFPEPTAIMSVIDSIGCGPLNVSFTNGSLNATNYFWDFGDGDTTSTNQAVVNHIYNNSTNSQAIYSASLISYTTHGCSDTTQQNITIHPPVTAGFVADSTGCSPVNITYTNTSIGGATYFWDFGDASVATGANPTHTFLAGSVADSSYNVTMVATSLFGCTDTIMDSVIVRHTATADVTTDFVSGCSPLEIKFTNNSYGFDNTYLDYGDGASLSTPFANVYHTYFNNSGAVDTNTASIIASTIYGCNDTLDVQITVYPSVEASFTGDTMSCSPLVVQFQNNSVGTSSYQWDFGNGNMSNLITPTETFTATGQTQNYLVTLVSTSQYGCADTADLNLTVHPSAVASFYTSQLTGCTPIQVGFTNSSSDYDNLHWDFGDGSISSSTAATVSHTFVNPNPTSTIYNVQLVASTMNGCNDTATIQMEVYPEVIADAIFDTAGCSPFYVPFNNTSVGGNSYLWDLGNGVTTSNPNPDETYINKGTTPNIVTVTLTTTSAYGCTDFFSQNIKIYAEPVASFFATPTIQSYPMTVVNITNTTTGNWTYNWDLGNGNTTSVQNPGSIDYMNVGDYNIELVISNPHCSDTSLLTVSILPPPPVADFTGNMKGCSPVTVSFVNLSEYGTDYLWDFGDGNTSIEENPTYTYHKPGVYTVSVTVTGLSGTDSKVMVDVVEVYPNAVANFDYQPIKVSTMGDNTFFYNQSASANIFLWNFGDGGSSSDENPIYQYQTPGEFPITLIANNQYNCPDTMTHATFITVESTGEIGFPNAFVPNRSGPSGGMYDPNVMDNSIFHPISQGIADFHLVIYNRWGEMVFESFDINHGWDGYYRGEVSAQDVYVWRVEAILVSGEEKIYKGDVTLLQ